MAKTHGAQPINERDGKWDGEGRKIQRKKKEKNSKTVQSSQNKVLAKNCRSFSIGFHS